MEARNELLAYLGAAIATVVLLFGLQIWYATYLDTHVVNVHPADAPANREIAARREREHAKLASGKMPIARAKAELAQRGRTTFPNITPKQSSDLSPMAGWMHQPGFKPYVPRPAPAAAAPAIEAEPTETPAAAGADTQAATQESETAVATPDRPAGRRPAPTAQPAPGRTVRPEPVVKTPPGATPPAQP